jgi:chorismate mutase-like protein
MNQGTESNTKSLETWREEIDLLDAELLRLLNQRAAVACRIGAVKVAASLPAYDGRRERQVLARVRAQNPGPFPSESVARIFRRIIVETRKIGKQAMQQELAKQEHRAGEERRNGYQHGGRRV